MVNLLDAVLCYVEGDWAYFTTQPLHKQWGDDWNDAPYEHNAGTPYEWYEGRGGAPWEIIRVAFSGPFEQPDTWTQNSRYSVEMINRGDTPWLLPDRYPLASEEHAIKIYAGTSLREFVVLVERAGGTVYLSRQLVRETGL